MKTERRHELQHNELADWIAQKYKLVQPYMKSIAAVIIAAFVLYFAYATISSRSKENQEKEWAKLQSTDPADMLKNWLDLTQRFGANTPLGMTARMEMGNYSLDSGSSRSRYGTSSAKEAKENLDRALTSFTEVSRDATDPSIRQDALFKLAKVQALLCNIKAAEDTFQKLASEKGPDNAYAADAKANAADLRDQKTKDFYQALITLQDNPSPVKDTTPTVPGFATDDFLNPPSMTDNKSKSFELFPDGAKPDAPKQPDSTKPEDPKKPEEPKPEEPKPETPKSDSEKGK